MKKFFLLSANVCVTVMTFVGMVFFVMGQTCQAKAKSKVPEWVKSVTTPKEYACWEKLNDFYIIDFEAATLTCVTPKGQTLKDRVLSSFVEIYE